MVSGTDDRAVNPETCKALVKRYGARGTFLSAKGHAHFLFLEPGWEKVAEEIETWLMEKVGTAQ